MHDVVTSDSDSETQFSDSEEHSDDEEQAYIEQSYKVLFVADTDVEEHVVVQNK